MTPDPNAAVTLDWKMVALGATSGLFTLWNLYQQVQFGRQNDRIDGLKEDQDTALKQLAKDKDKLDDRLRALEHDSWTKTEQAGFETRILDEIRGLGKKIDTLMLQRGQN